MNSPWTPYKYGCTTLILFGSITITVAYTDADKLYHVTVDDMRLKGDPGYSSIGRAQDVGIKAARAMIAQMTKALDAAVAASTDQD